MDQLAGASQLQRPALGRLGFIGELYDARSECLSSTSLLKRPIPPTFVQTIDMNHVELEYKFIENSSDRFELLNVQGELHVSVLLGLVKVEGSAQFLTETVKSGEVASCSLVNKFQTVNDKLIASSEEIVPYLDLAALNDSQFTHVIAEIVWGANCILSLEHSCCSEAGKEDLKGRLEGEITRLKLFILNGRGEAEQKESKSTRKNAFDVKVRADVIPEEGLPTSVDGFQKLVEDIPKLLKKVNGGKGKPLSYVMIPLSVFRSLAKLESRVDVEVKKIDDSFVTSLVYFFDDVARIKQKIRDVVALFDKNTKYVPSTVLKEARQKEREISLRESELKTLISEDWVEVKSGRKKLQDLVRKVEQYKHRSFALFLYEDFLDSCSSISDKLSRVNRLASKGVVYLGAGDRFEDLHLGNHSGKLFVMVTSAELQAADPELDGFTTALFLTLVEERASDTRYVVLDLDYGQKSLVKADKVRLVHLEGAKIVCADFLAAHIAEATSNYARPKSASDRQLCTHKPGNRVHVQIPCPGYAAGRCAQVPREWRCHSCKTNLEYGFDGNYYCSCGKASADAFEYRCSESKHGTAFVPASSDFLKKVLGRLRPLKEMNLLLIGQSGVGKSTWINGIVNYLTYDTLEDAKEGGAVIAVPAEIRMGDGKSAFRVGKDFSNEVTEAGKSATQFSSSYSFIWEGYCVRLIDTPGLGDTRGIQKDKDNMKNLMDHISHLKELHGVCILIKANDNRMHSMFVYCVKELLVHLHRNIARNIVFCFTNARSSLYTPGQASVLVEKIIDGLETKDELRLGKHNMFCLDNEPFLYLCAIENGLTFDDDLAQSFEKSWDISLKETRRLFRTVMEFEAHEVKQTLSLLRARMRVLLLTKPLAEVTKTIQINLDTCKRKEKEVRDKNLTVEELKKKLFLNEVHLEPVALDYPRTVCTSPKCVEYVPYSTTGVKEIEYKTHCHEHCYLNNVTPKTVNNVALRKCQAMSYDKCTVCGCSWENHMHITFSQKRVEKTVTDKTVEASLGEEETAKKQIESFIAEVRKRIGELEQEKDFINKATAKFGMFLKQNAITVYNDALEEYLLLLIQHEENKPHKSVQELEFLDSLKDNLARYRAEVDVLTTAIESGKKDAGRLTPEEVYALEKGLYSLKHMGKVIKNFVELSEKATNSAVTYNEQQIPLKTAKKSNPGLMGYINKGSDWLLKKFS